LNGADEKHRPRAADVPDKIGEKRLRWPFRAEAHAKSRTFEMKQSTTAGLQQKWEWFFDEKEDGYESLFLYW
jgi:hypothetical protein